MGTDRTDPNVSRQDDDLVTDPVAVAALGRELIESWRFEGFEAVTFGQRGHRPDAQRFVSVWALAAHVHLLVDEVLTLLDDARDLAALPLLRLAYESTITAQWMAHNPEAGLAAANEEIRTQRALRLASEKSVQFGPKLSDWVPSDLTVDGVSSDAQARNFEQRCADLVPDGGTLYVFYRILCKYSHPTGFVMDRFVTVGDEGIESLHAVAIPPVNSDRGLWTFLAVMCLVWAGRAVDFIQPEHPRRSQLRLVARQIGALEHLELSHEATARISSAEQQRRRGKWLGPRKKAKRRPRPGPAPHS